MELTLTDPSPSPHISRRGRRHQVGIPTSYAATHWSVHCNYGRDKASANMIIDATIEHTKDKISTLNGELAEELLKKDWVYLK
jgi:hypothetical protein